MNREIPVNLDKQAAHRDTVSQYFSTQTDFWDLVYSDVSGACNSFLDFHMRRRRDVVLDLLGDCQLKDGAVLDVGCGSGALLVSMSGFGCQVFGTDISSGMVEKARQLACSQGIPPEHIQLGSVESLPYEDGFFDVVTCVGVLEYVCDEKIALMEMKRVVKPDGKIIITMPNIFKLQYLLDPYYWFVRSIKYVFHIKNSKSKPALSGGGINQLSTNKNYTNKRYSSRQISNFLNDTDLAPTAWVGIGYGPFTLCKKKLFSEDFSKKASDHLERLFRKFSISRCFTNRWILCLKKDGK